MKTLARPADRAELVARLRTLGPTSTRKGGRMSVHQMVCHLGDAFRMAMGHRAVTQATGLVQRTLMKGIALYAPIAWPAGILTRPEVDQEAGGTRPAEFSADVAEVERLMAIFAAAADCDSWPPHPIFGAMSKRAWLRWGYLHTDHHLRQFSA
jgi:hypothetical protein